MSAGMDPSGAGNHIVRGLVVEMVVEQGFPEPFSLRRPSIFGLHKPNSGGGGGIRTCD
jgi:hypothetical protein